MSRSTLSGMIVLSALAGLAPAANAIEVRELHRITSAESIKWQPAPPVFPRGAQFAVMVGNPKKAGPFVIRMKLPDGYSIPAHWHTRPEHGTILAGRLNIGMGEKLDKTRTQPLGVGGFFAMPARMPHYAWVEGETVIDVFANGPFDMHYVDKADDPSKVPMAEGAKAPKSSRRGAAPVIQ